LRGLIFPFPERGLIFPFPSRGLPKEVIKPKEKKTPTRGGERKGKERREKS
jgi:hypothetical protein